MSATSSVELICAAGFAGDASFVDSGAGFPQPESKTASKRQQGENRFRASVMGDVMGTKGCEQNSRPKRAEEVTS
jgi:hypothetical protein